MHNNSDGNKRIAKNTFFLYGRMIIVLLVSLYTTRVVLNNLGVVDYGIQNVVAGFVSMFAFLNTSMINAIQRFYNYERGRGNVKRLQDIYNTSLQIQTILAIITLFLVELIGIWYINNKMVMPENRVLAAHFIFQFSVISLLLVIIQIPYSSAIVSHEKMDYFAVISIVDVMMKLLIAFLISIVHSDKLIVYGFLLFIVSSIDFLLYFIYSKKKFDELKFELKFHPELFKQMLSFSGWNVFEAVAFTVQGQGLNMLINAFFGPAINAARGVAFQIQNAIKGFAENISTAFRPQLVESYAKENYGRTRNLMFSLSKLCFLMLYILSLPLIIEADYILKLWLGPTIPPYTVVFLVLVLVNRVLGSLNMPMSQVVQATGNIKNYQIIRSVLIISILPVSWIMLKNGFDAYWVFIITILITVINQPLSMFLLHNVFPYSYKEYCLVIIIPCMAFGIFAAILPFGVHLLFPESIFRLILVTFLSVTFSLLFGYIVVLDKIEKAMVLKYIEVVKYKILKK